MHLGQGGMQSETLSASLSPCLLTSPDKKLEADACEDKIPGNKVCWRSEPGAQCPSAHAPGLESHARQLQIPSTFPFYGRVDKWI